MYGSAERCGALWHDGCPACSRYNGLYELAVSPSVQDRAREHASRRTGSAAQAGL